MKKWMLQQSGWLFGAAVVALPMICGGVVLMAHAQVARTSGAINELAREARQGAAELEAAAARAPDPRELNRIRADMDERRAEAQKSAAVVAAMTAACERAGARVESVRPIVLPGTSGDAAPDAAQFNELVVRADCGAIVKLLDDIATIRVPLRVNSVNIKADDRGPDQPFGSVRAIITVEAWRAAPAKAAEVRR